jgi:hypothetical protein
MRIRLTTISLVSFCLIMSMSCNKSIKSFSLEKVSVTEICQSRKDAIAKLPPSQQKAEYKILKKKSKEILEKLDKALLEKRISFGLNSKINIVDNYDFESNTHGGTIWSGDSYVVYRYKFETKKIEIVKKGKSFSDYPENSIIHIILINFLKKIRDANDFNNMPGSGRSNNGYCVFSRIDRNILTNEVESFAFKQW